MDCPVCLDRFTDPVVLPCGHTLCRNGCAERLVQEDCIKCPTCRTVHWVPGGQDGLPRNYALQECLESPANTLDIPPNCSVHTDCTVSLFCTQCLKLVCLRCCLAPTNGSKPKHFQHEVTTLDEAADFIQNVTQSAAEYLESRHLEEMTKFDDHKRAKRHFQEMVKKEHSSIQNEHKRLRSLLDDRSRLLIGQLQSLYVASRLPHQSQASLERILEYKNLIQHCQNILCVENHERKRDSVWKKCEELGQLLYRIDELSPSGDYSDLQTISNMRISINTEPLHTAIEQTLTLVTDPPGVPSFSLLDCVFGNTSVALCWNHQPTDKVKHFTVCYDTAIFLHGQCKDCKAIEVTDFGRSSARITIPDLQKGHRYRVFVTAHNEAGAGPRSSYLYFKADSNESEVKLI